MSYYKFDPKNHICSLAWTGLILLGQLDTSKSIFEKFLATSIMGGSTVFVGINLREKSEIDKRKKIINTANLQREVTVNQTSDLLDISGQQARDLLNSLVTEERLEITNRPQDMAVVYVPTNY